MLGAGLTQVFDQAIEAARDLGARPAPILGEILLPRLKKVPADRLCADLLRSPEGDVGRIGFNTVEADALTEAAICSGRNTLSSGPRLIQTAEIPEVQTVPMGGTAPLTMP